MNYLDKIRSQRFVKMSLLKLRERKNLFNHVKRLF